MDVVLGPSCAVCPLTEVVGVICGMSVAKVMQVKYQKLSIPLTKDSRF